MTPLPCGPSTGPPGPGISSRPSCSSPSRACSSAAAPTWTPPWPTSRENFDPVTKQSKKETALRLDFLMGARLRIIDRPHFCMYSQAFLGKDFRNDCEYWTIANEFIGDGHEEKVDYQVTFLGFQVDLGKESNLGFVTEFGYGYEYSLSQLFVFIPGIRAGVSYKF